MFFLDSHPQLTATIVVPTTILSPKNAGLDQCLLLNLKSPYYSRVAHSLSSSDSEVDMDLEGNCHPAPTTPEATTTPNVDLTNPGQSLRL